MKKILVSSILAATAGLSMIGQANAAPNVTPQHSAQGSHQKAGGKKAAHKQTQVKKKAAARAHSAKKVAAPRAHHKYPDKHHQARG